MAVLTKGGRRRTAGVQWPDLPRVPKSLRASPDVATWDAQMQDMWKNFRGQLDRLNTEGRAVTLINGGATEIIRTSTGGFGGGGGSSGRSSGGSGGGVGQNGPLNLGPNLPFTSKEGGRYLVALNGGKVFYQDVAPSEGKEGDEWFDTSNSFHPYVFHNGKWQDVFGDVPTLAPLLGTGFDARALLAEVNARADALLAEKNDRNAAVASLAQSQQTASTSFSRKLTVVNGQLGNQRARITNEVTARVDADGVLADSIDTVSVVADAAAAAVVTEVSARIAADGTITANLSTEISARSTADSTLAASVSTEASARVSADGSLSSEYVLKVVTGGTSGQRVAGFRITNLGGAGGSSDMVVQVDKFSIVDTSGNNAKVPFKVSGGVVFIDKAVITEVNAGSILAGTISAALTINSPVINSGTIFSTSGQIAGLTLDTVKLYNSLPGSQFMEIGSNGSAHLTLGDSSSLALIMSSFSGIQMLGSSGVDIAAFGAPTGGYARLYVRDVAHVSSVTLDGSNGSVVATGDITANGDLHGTNLYVGGVNASFLNGTVLGTINTTYLKAGVASAVDVTNGNLRGFNGASQTWRIDFTNGFYYVQGNNVVGARGVRGAAGLAEIVTLLDAWGAWA